ncbi:ABC transporter permease [Rhizobium sp. 2YAF20]|uniref:ABC transporter permease n=1 Tax=Rhizobium sp. 2YAF20 TaxID=3233027 RepID=UPI003F99C72D
MGLCNLTEVVCGFPSFDDTEIRLARKTIDDGFRTFVRWIGPAIDVLVLPLQHVLNGIEQMFVEAPWFIVFAIILSILYAASRSLTITVLSAIALCAIGLLDLWNDTMITLSMVTVSTFLAIASGIPIGILMALSNRAQSTLNPVLDVMQTLPSFVYLIPVVMIFGIGKVPGLIAVVIYAVAPMIRLTNLGIRLVSEEMLEAADAYGASPWQKLKGVQLPLALPTIMAGINQTIMMALAMVVVASMVGVGGLGKNVLQSINSQFFTVGLVNGLAVVAIAVIFDRASQAYGQRLQRHRGGQ